MEEKKWGTYKVSIDKIGRKWTQVTIHYPSGYTHAATIDKNSLLDHSVGDEVDVLGCLKIESNGYGRKYTLIATDEDAVKQGEAERWWGYFQEHYKNGKYYVRAIEEMHKLDCHKYDGEIEKYKKEIDDKKQAEAEKKRQEIAKKKQAERDAGITRLSLPAYSGFRGRPEKGSIIMEGGVPYKVLSAYYHDSDGWSFGAMNDEWYDVKVQNISDTELGQKMIADEKYQKQLSALKKKCSQTLYQLERSIRNHGERYTGEEISKDDIPGETLVNSFNIYGGGIIIRHRDDVVWLIVNNGADGDAWDINNIRTGGAGAYAFSVSVKQIKDTLQAYLDANATYAEFTANKKVAEGA